MRRAGDTGREGEPQWDSTRQDTRGSEPSTEKGMEGGIKIMEPEQLKFNTCTKLQTKVWGINFKRVLTKLQKGGLWEKGWRAEAKKNACPGSSREDRIVSIYTREVGGDTQSQDILAHRNLRWRGAPTLMVEFWEASINLNTWPY